MNQRPPRLFCVTDDRIAARPDFVDQASAIFRACGGRGAVQLRAHGMSGRAFYELAVVLRERADAAGSQFWINDRADIAVLVRADGLHLGTRSLPPSAARRLVGRRCQIGYSAHSSSEAEKSFHSGADLVILGNVYESPSHPERRPLGLDELGAAAGRGRPIVAIGGIAVTHVKELIEAGAWGFAIKSGVWEAEDPGEAARMYVDALEAALGFDAVDDDE